MTFLSILLFVISSNIDSIIIGLSLGIKKIKISFKMNIIISAITSIGTLLSIFIGKLFNLYLPLMFSKFIGSSLLILLGLYIIYSFYKNKHAENSLNNYELYLNNPEYIDKDNSKNIELRESISLGLILSINNVGIGLGAGIAGLNPIITSLSVFFFNIIFLKLGCFLGNCFFTKLIKKYSELFSGILIITLAVYEFFI